MRQLFDELTSLLETQPRPPEDSTVLGTTLEKISSFEERTSILVPDQLRHWLLHCNGACVGPGGVFGIKTKRDFLDIERLLSLHPSWRDKGWLPVAGDGCGNYYLLITREDFGRGEPVVFIDVASGDESPTFIVGSSLFVFLWFLFGKELGKTTWPFDASEVVAKDRRILDYNGVSLPWNAD